MIPEELHSVLHCVCDQDSNYRKEKQRLVLDFCQNLARNSSGWGWNCRIWFELIDLLKFNPEESCSDLRSAVSAKLQCNTT